MKFRLKTRDGGILTYECNVIENQNLISLRKTVVDNFFPNSDPKSVQFTYNGKALDFNRPLLQLVNLQNAEIDCQIDSQINSSDLFILNIDRDFGHIQVHKSMTISQLKDEISDICGMRILSIIKDNKVLTSGTLQEKLMDNDKIIPVGEENGQLNVYPIIENCEAKHVLYKNDEKVLELKERIAKMQTKSVDDFILSFDEDILDESKYIYEYPIRNESVIKYCFFDRKVVGEALTDKIAVGQFSVVYKTRLVDTGEEITLKKYNIQGHSLKLASYKPMIRELISFDRLTGCNRFTQLKTFYRDNEAFYIGMEYMPGGSLHAYLKEKWPLSDEIISKWAKQILEGLVFLHKQRVIHRDLKMSNILLDEIGNVKISGFSLSKYVVGANSADLNRGFVQSKSGTYRYMAPEVLNYEESGSKADIWSFGVILIELFTSEPPYKEMNDYDFGLEISRTREIKYKRDKMSSLLTNIIDRCLKYSPSDRPTALELIDDEFITANTGGIAMEQD